MKKPARIGEQVLAALTNRQIAAVLDAALVPEKMDIRGFLGRLAKEDQDASRVLEDLLVDEEMESAPSGRELSMSRDKLLVVWRELWDHWEDIAMEVGKEKGKYSVQDAHWEPPYFDPYHLVEDLEKVADTMQVFLEDVFMHLEQTPQLFSQALADLEARVDDFPEWMGAEHTEPCELGPETTTCILQWLWLNARDKDDAGVRFLESFQEQLAALSLFELNPQACGHFFASLPPEAGRSIHAHIRAQGLREKANRGLWTVWDQIQYDLDLLFDPARYLATCRQKLPDAWHYGLPLIEEAQSKGDHEAVETWLGKTFASLLRQKEKWLPEGSLIAAHSSFSRQNEEDGATIVRLLSIWADSAQARGNPVRAAAARLQAVVLEKTFDVHSVLSTLNAEMRPDTEHALVPLFQTWKGYLAGRSRCARGYGMERDVTWVHWLVEAARMGPEGRAFFSGKLTGWLASMKTGAKLDHGDYECLECLSADLDKIAPLANTLPAFATLFPDSITAGAWARSRQALLRELQAHDHWEEILNIWKRHLAGLIPKPAAASKADYSEHAKWMKALLELDPSGYQRVLEDWRANHSRRRNLWTEMREQGLPV